MKKTPLPFLFLTLSLSLFLALGLATPASAKSHSARHPKGPWHGDIHRFHDRDFDHWKRGRWFHGPHGGRRGWWWIVGNIWYFYPAPIYPYPDPYTPPTVVIQTTPETQVAQGYWYCSNPAGYYPYVPLCYAAWQRITTTTVIPTPGPQVAAVAATPQPNEAPVQLSDQQSNDYQQLNGFSARLSEIDKDDKSALSKLEKLHKEVEAFRKSLLKRDYNAMNILGDAEDLKDRIAEQQKTLHK
jgi:hypothetical protein